MKGSYPDFVARVRASGMPDTDYEGNPITDEAIVKAFEGTLTYALWELGKSVYELWTLLLPMWLVRLMYKHD